MPVMVMHCARSLSASGTRSAERERESYPRLAAYHCDLAAQLAEPAEILALPGAAGPGRTQVYGRAGSDWLPVSIAPSCTLAGLASYSAPIASCLTAQLAALSAGDLERLTMSSTLPHSFATVEQ